VWGPSNATNPALTDDDWRDNSSGDYTRYIGQIASVTTTATAAFNNAATAQSTANDASTSAGQAASAANAANTTANNLSYEWSVVGTLDGAPAGSIRLLGASRTNPITGVRSTASNLIIDANTTINGNLLVTGSVTGAQIGTGDVNGVKTTNLVSNAVSTGNFISGFNSSSSPTSLPVTVRAGATVQVIANCNGGSSETTEGYLSDFPGNLNRPGDPSTAVEESGRLYIDRTIGSATTTSSFAIMGRFVSSRKAATGTYGGGYYGYNNYRTYISFGQTGVAFYRNTTASDQSVTFYARSSFDPTVTISMSVVELAR
jgi:hypothetical protein